MHTRQKCTICGSTNIECDFIYHDRNVYDYAGYLYVCLNCGACKFVKETNTGIVDQIMSYTA